MKKSTNLTDRELLEAIYSQNIDIQQRLRMISKFMSWSISLWEWVVRMLRYNDKMLVKKSRVLHMLDISSTVLNKLISEGKLNPVKISDGDKAHYYFNISEVREVAQSGIPLELISEPEQLLADAREMKLLVADS